MDWTERMQIALFRYQVIAPLLSIKPGGGQLQQSIAKLAALEWSTPFRGKTKLSAKTIEEWYYKYSNGGIDALLPAVRTDKALSRTITGKLADIIEEMLTAQPKLTGPMLFKELAAKGHIQPGQISLSSFYRFRKAKGLDKHPPAQKKDRRAFIFENPNDCWQCDLMYGPHLARPDGSRARTYLYAILDDCTRLICHAQIYLDQHLKSFQDCLKQALMKRGVPKKLYVDNAKVFRSRCVLLASAQLAIHLIHSRPGEPQGRGKIERWFQTTRTQFFSRLDTKALTDLDHLNDLLWAWIEGEYHLSKHRGIDEAPIDKWVRLSDAVKPLPVTVDLDRIFLSQTSRRVKRDGTFQLKGKLFEAGVQFIDEKIQVLFDPFDLRWVWISSDRHLTEIQAFPVDALGNRAITRLPDPPKPKPKAITFSSLEHLRRQMNVDPSERDDDEEEGDGHVPAPVPS